MDYYSVHNLEYAVSIFYNGEQSERAQAHAWLTAAQHVPEAWNFVWELLDPNKSTEIQFYAATTLHTKILRHWNEIPPGSHEELREKLLQAVMTYSRGPKLVTNRLCISLAAFILQQGSTELVDVLRPLSAAENASLLLEVLTVIPEEYNSMTMGSALRTKNRTALQQALPGVLDDMLQYFNTVYNDYSKDPPSQETIRSWQAAATCATSWLTLGGEYTSEIFTPLPERMPLCRALLTAVHVLYSCNEVVSECALDACEACLAAVRVAGCAGDALQYPTSALQLFAQLTAVATPVIQRENVPNSINEELLSALITCIVAIGDNHALTLVKVVEGKLQGESCDVTKQLLEMLLQAQAVPGYYPIHETRSKLLFGIWCAIQDQVLNNFDVDRGMNQVWINVFSRLLSILLVKSEAPPEHALTKDELELLRCYRQDISDTVMYCFGILGEWCWTKVEEAFNAADNEARREAALHVFMSLSEGSSIKVVTESKFKLLGYAVDVANTTNDMRTLNTALECIGSYASWISSLRTERSYQLGGDCIRTAGASLQRCPGPAAIALRKLCLDCKVPSAMMVADVVHAAKTIRAEVLIRRQLMAAAGGSLSAAELDVAAPLLQPLAEMLRDELAAQTVTADRPEDLAKCVATLATALSYQTPLLVSLVRVILPTMPAYARHPALLEQMFYIFKYVIPGLLEECVSFMNEISYLVLTAFATRPCAIGLEIAKLIVLVIDNEWADTGQLFEKCIAMSARAVASDPTGSSDLTDALFYTLHSIMKKKSEVMDWIEDHIPDLVLLACSCVRIWELSSARSACTWLVVLAANWPMALEPVAATLTTDVLRCIGGLTPRNHMHVLADLLLEMNRTPKIGNFGTWLREALAMEGFPTVHATPAHKQKFIAAIVRETISKRRVLDAMEQFSIVCRGLVGTEYARQTLSSKHLVA